MDQNRPNQDQGVDLSLIEANLRRTPQERFQFHDRARTSVTQLQEAMEKKRIEGKSA